LNVRIGVPLLVALRAAAFLVFASLPPGAVAHHSFAAEFDRNKPVDVAGTVTHALPESSDSHE
jgi:hypothetical protein